MKVTVGLFLLSSITAVIAGGAAYAQRAGQPSLPFELDTRPQAGYGAPLGGAVTPLGQSTGAPAQGSGTTGMPNTQGMRPTTGDAGPARVIPRGGELPLTSDQAPPLGPNPLHVSNQSTQPFGANIFQSQFLVGRSQGVNPSYVVSPGDQIMVNVWGARTFSGTLTVDLQGNVFLPEVGPIAVGGLPNSALNTTIRAALRRVYTDAVDAYTNLLNTQPVSVFVTGAVPRPGRYPGDRFDSLLYFLSQAGGPDRISGSYRDITIRRGNEVLAQVDLYDFLLNGRFPLLQFRDNDTIIVGPRGPAVEVQGDVANAYIFEVASHVTTGAMLMHLARPRPSVSHVAIRGLRGGQSYTAYLPLDQFANLPLENGDFYNFQSDHIDNTVFVSVIGQSAGPSSFAIRRGAPLGHVLSYIEVDPQVANLEAIYLRRRSVAKRQQRALETALQELQRSVLTTSSSTDSQAAIRVQEAQLVERFVAQARSVRPEGRVVLANGPGSRDIRLEADDEIVIPQRSDVVLVSGEVRLPQSVLYRPGKAIADYVADAGGYTERSDESRFIVLRQNGLAETGGGSLELKPGDHIMVLPRVDTKGFAIFKDIVEMVYRIALSSAVVIRLND